MTWHFQDADEDFAEVQAGDLQVQFQMGRVQGPGAMRWGGVTDSHKAFVALSTSSSHTSWRMPSHFTPPHHPIPSHHPTCRRIS